MTRPRDTIFVDSHAVGGKRRSGRIVEVLGTPDRPRYRVRWEDGRETIVYPGSDASIDVAGAKPPRRRRGPARQAAAAPEPAPRRTPGVRAAPGDRLVIHPHRLGKPERDAEILEVGEGGRPPFRVRWQDTGTEALFFPGSDALVEHFGRDGKPRRRPRARAG